LIGNGHSASPRLALVLFGPPGSGKGTQAKLLRDCLRLPHVSTGDILREHVQAGDAVGLLVEAIMKSGKLVPDELVNSLLEERLQRDDCASGFILDGYPRTVQQAARLDKGLTVQGIRQVVIHLLVDYNKIIARLTGRRQCVACGALYNLSTNPPKVVDKCDLDGGRLIVREDDREDVIRARLAAYDEQTRPVLDYYRLMGHGSFDVDGSDDPPAVVAQRICTFIKG
jgi:adenylate kinase